MGVLCLGIGGDDLPDKGRGGGWFLVSGWFLISVIILLSIFTCWGRCYVGLNGGMLWRVTYWFRVILDNSVSLWYVSGVRLGRLGLVVVSGVPVFRSASVVVVRGRSSVWRTRGPVSPVRVRRVKVGA